MVLLSGLSCHNSKTVKRVITYYSQSLSKEERRYCVTRQDYWP